jgi:hypothetical protein
VTHGPTTDVGFWGEVYEPALRRAHELGVELVPLHPATEVTGAQLNMHMRTAVDARPAGILATLWGAGMVEVVREANRAAIPIAAINVRPDASEYERQQRASDLPESSEKGGFLFYSGQDDFTSALTMTRSLVCQRARGVLAADDTTCADGETTVAEAWAALEAEGPVRTGCLVHQLVLPCFQRCAAFLQVVEGLGATSYEQIEWTASVPGAGEAAVRAFLTRPENQAASSLLVLGCGPLSTEILRATFSSVPDNLAYVTFDTTEVVCEGLETGQVTLTSGQGHRLQAVRALEYLHHYVTQGELPAEGESPDGGQDLRWTSDAQYRLYATGPELISDPSVCRQQ